MGELSAAEAAVQRATGKVSGCGGVENMQKASRAAWVAAGSLRVMRGGGAGKPGAKQTGGAAKTLAAAAKTAARAAPLFLQREEQRGGRRRVVLQFPKS